MRRRSTPIGTSNLRSPFDTMFNFIPQGHEKALKHALYNALAIFLMIICVSGVIALFYILEPFIKPLLWALLCGSVLHPFKQSLADILTMWLEELDKSSTPLCLAMMLAPIQAVDAVSEWALCAALFRWKLILGFISSLILLFGAYNYTPGVILCFARASLLTILLVADMIVDILSTPMVTAVIVAHLVAVGLWWYNPTRPLVSSTVDGIIESKEEMLHRRLRSFLRASATLVWILTGGYLVGEGFLLHNEEYKSLRTPAFLTFFVLLALGFLSEIWERYTKNQILQVKTGDSNPVDFLKWAVFLRRGATDEELLGPRRTQEQDEKQDLPQESTSSTISLPSHLPSELKEEQKQVENQNLQKENKDSVEPKPTLSRNEAENGESLTETPKKVKRITFLEDPNHSNEAKGEEDFIVTKERQPIQKLSKPTLGSVSLHERNLTMSDPEFPSQLNSMGRGRFSEAEEEEDPNLLKSYTFIYGVMWACVFVQFLKNPWILQLLFLPLIMCLLHRTCRYFEVWSKICYQVKPLTDILHNWYEPRQEAIFPLAVKGLSKLMSKLNRKLTITLMSGVDAAASLVVMFGLITFGLTALVFFVVQSYGESFHMLQVCGNVINSTIMNNPELSAYLPEGIETMVDNTLNNAYVYGREGLVSLIRSLLGTEESEARDRIETQVLELWDRVYQAWVMGGTGCIANVSGPKVTDDAVLTSWDNLLETVQKTPGLMNFKAWSQFAQENLETLVSLVNSIWLLFKGNITLFITIITTLLSVVFGGGSAVFGFIISTVVFLTALFYLLNSSGRQYKPVEIISIFSPTNGPRIGRAFEAAINGVFEASFKMALFYGLWTWFIHNIFQMQIVYIPTALAAVLAAVPFLGVYWASLPAVIDLWLSQGKGLQAILIFLAILLPCSMVDTAIYKELKSGGHPYLTGLSIAGGIFCLGVEGAIMGPMLLCCLLVVLNLSSNLIKDSTSETVVPVHLRRMRRMDTVL